jgi:glycerophosphoryl diester phosphodiesterase
MRKNASVPRMLALLTALSVSALARADASEVAMPARGICAHRGANSVCPENTIAAFREAIRLGVQQIELDVHLLKDGNLAVIHDETVDRTTDGHGPVSGFTLEGIKKLDAGSNKHPKFAGERIPTLAEALAIMPRNIWLNVHLKGDKPLGAAVAREVVRQQRTRQAFLACGHAAAEGAHEVCPDVLICNMERQDDVVAYVANTVNRKSDFIQLLGKPCSPEDVARLKKAGVKINLFPVNDPAVLKTAFDAGVDFPLVDKTAEMMEAAKALGIEPVKPAD